MGFNFFTRHHKKIGESNKGDFKCNEHIANSEELKSLEVARYDQTKVGKEYKVHCLICNSILIQEIITEKKFNNILKNKAV